LTAAASYNDDDDSDDDVVIGLSQSSIRHSNAVGNSGKTCPGV